MSTDSQIHAYGQKEIFIMDCENDELYGMLFRPTMSKQDLYEATLRDPLRIFKRINLPSIREQCVRQIEGLSSLEQLKDIEPVITQLGNFTIGDTDKDFARRLLKVYLKLSGEYPYRGFVYAADLPPKLMGLSSHEIYYLTLVALLTDVVTEHLSHQIIVEVVDRMASSIVGRFRVPLGTKTSCEYSLSDWQVLQKFVDLTVKAHNKKVVWPSRADELVQIHTNMSNNRLSSPRNCSSHANELNAVWLGLMLTDLVAA